MLGSKNLVKDSKGEVRFTFTIKGLKRNNLLTLCINMEILKRKFENSVEKV